MGIFLAGLLVVEDDAHMVKNRNAAIGRAGFLVLCGMMVGLLGTPPTRSENMEEFRAAEISTVGLDLLTRSPVVLLRDLESSQVVPIWVGLAEAQAIARALHGVKMPRPMTHDLMASLLGHLEASVEDVLVHDLREGMYLGKIRLKRNGQAELIEVDSRPSDAMALALRMGAPIQVAKKILQEAPDIEFLAPEGPEQVVRVVGMTVVSVTPALREQFELGEREGVVVTAVSGKAEEQGLRRGDLILKVNGEKPGSPMDFFEAVRKTSAGEPVRLDVWRGGEEKAIEVPLETPPQPAPRRREGQFEV